MNTTNHTSPSGEDAANGAMSDTGNAEADRIINRLSSSDPDFDDCIDAVAFIRKLVAEHKGPEGFATWNDAAVWERQRRLAAEKSLRDTSKELISAVAEQSADRVTANGASWERADIEWLLKLAERSAHDGDLSIARVRAALAANGAIGERPIDEEDAFQDWWKTRKGKNTNAYHGWMARAALTAEKVAGQVVDSAIVDCDIDMARAVRAATHEVSLDPYMGAQQQPAQSAEQDERAAFESDYAKVWNAAMKENGWSGGHTADDVKDLRDGNTYGKGRDYLNARWEGWQARALLAAQPVSGGKS